MIIVGAGMSGMLAAHYFRHLKPTVIEKQPELPNNHKALLRFRSEAVSDLTGIPFKKVNVQKMISFEGALRTESNIMLNNLYSQKVTGGIRQRSIGNLSDCSRYIAPSDFIEKLSNGIRIDYKTTLENVYVDGSAPIISTMPVHSLAKYTGYGELPELESLPIWTMSFDLDINIDVYQTVYYPSHRLPLYRLSITGRKIIAEFNEPIEDSIDVFEAICHLLDTNFGILYKGDADIKVSHQKYGKLIECETSAVKDFIGWASREHNIYSLGRWGTHRQLLMDDVVNDLKVVGRMIRSNGYSR